MNPALLIEYTPHVEYKQGVRTQMQIKYVVPARLYGYVKAIQDMVCMNDILKEGAKTITIMENMKLEHVDLIKSINYEHSASRSDVVDDITVELDVYFRVPTSVITPVIR